MTLSSVLTSLTRSSPTLTTQPSSGAVSTKRSVFRLLLHPLCPSVVTASGLGTNMPSCTPLFLPHSHLIMDHPIVLTALQSVPCFVFPGGGECTHGFVQCLCLSHHIFLLFRDLKHKVMVWICHPVLFLLILARNCCTKY